MELKYFTPGSKRELIANELRKTGSITYDTIIGLTGWEDGHAEWEIKQITDIWGITYTYVNGVFSITCSVRISPLAA